MYYFIKKYLKHETIWRQNVLLKQKVMLTFREVIERASPTRDEQTDANTKKPASVCIVRFDYIYRKCSLRFAGFWPAHYAS